MNILTKCIKQIKKKEDGAIIVEASIVFPIVLFVVIFIIYIGNIYYMIAQVDSIVNRLTVKGASFCSNKSLYRLEQEGVMITENKKIEPYRRLNVFSGSNDIEAYIKKQVEEQIEGVSSFFSSTKINSDVKFTAEHKNYVLYSTFLVEVNYSIEFPLKYNIFKNLPLIKANARAEVAVTDTAEFIRNVDMTIDYFEGTKAGDAIKNALDKAFKAIKTLEGK